MVEDPRTPDEPAREARRRAVALRYDDIHESAPRVLAKGQGDIAERIIALAHLHGIPLHEDKDLVRLLGVLDIDVQIPPALYRALAEVLAHLYRTNAKYAKRQKLGKPR
ncbi:MAG TPA: EscU/YscU/HrcU family type III secretion system export apparatus switch protein [Planctomycetota bacterium]|nr:EscU/YscU/HrcU family type III secretion system export apparatus switch protein [Planctomycetota bacterium]